jgi:hypothetical protein
MSMHIQKFVDRVRGHEARGARDFVMTMNEAKDLHADLTRLLISLQALQEQATKTNSNEVIQVEIGGGQF